MSRLLVGFDSAWTATNAGAIVGAVLDADGAIRELGHPTCVRYEEAAGIVQEWQEKHHPSSTLILLDQPTVVKNERGQRPVEQIVCASVCRRRGGTQPAYLGRREMFGTGAPLWKFLKTLGDRVDPFDEAPTRVIETYPVLAIIAMDWILADPQRAVGRLPKYNPQRRKTFSLSDWGHVCRSTAAALAEHGAECLAAWAESLASLSRPTKVEQDGLDACICLIVALHFARSKDMLFVGCGASGYMVVPYAKALQDELMSRCKRLGRIGSDWVRVLCRTAAPQERA
jgi:predicted RNase H-like nuclease